MKTSRLLLLAALLPLALQAQSPVPPLLYAQTAPVTIANTSDFASASSGTFYGTKRINFSSLAVGQTIRVHATGVISTAAGAQAIIPLVDFGAGAHQLTARYLTIPGGLTSALFEFEAILTIGDLQSPFNLGARGSCKLTVDGTIYSAPLPDWILAPYTSLSGPANDVDWRLGWGRADPSNSVTINTLVTEWLR